MNFCPNTLKAKQAKNLWEINAGQGGFFLVVYFLLLFVLSLQSWAQTEIKEAFPFRVPSTQPALRKPVRPVALPMAGISVHDMGPLTQQYIAEADRKAKAMFNYVSPGPRRVGIVRRILPTPLSVQKQMLKPTPLATGESVYRLALRSPGAAGIRIHFSAFDVGSATVLVYARHQGQFIVRGPYKGKGPTKNGDFWTAMLPGDEVIVEVISADDHKLSIPEILHFDRLPFSVLDDYESMMPSDVKFPCHLDVMCFGSPDIHPVARDAVGQINFVKDGLAFLCSGTLLNDSDDETIVPYFLTAFHCINKQQEAETMEVVWLWQKDVCDGTLPDYFQLPRNVGGTLLATSPTSGGTDMSFIRLLGRVPPGVGLAGWTTASLPDRAYGIHHPAGSWKRISFLEDNSLFACTVGFKTRNYHFLKILNGMIEGGSSGSPLLNKEGQVMGQLYGKCCRASLGTDCREADCDNKGDWRTVYGEFENSYDAIDLWLALGGTIHVDGSYSGIELGLAAAPFNTVQEAYDFAWDGVQIKIKAGSYPESLTMTKSVKLIAKDGPVTIGL